MPVTKPKSVSANSICETHCAAGRATYDKVEISGEATFQSIKKKFAGVDTLLFRKPIFRKNLVQLLWWEK